MKREILVLQVAKNISISDEDIGAIIQDYVKTTNLLARYADIVVVNIFCPNALGFQEFMQVESLTRILIGVVGAAASVDRKSKPAVMIKAGLDENTEEQIASRLGNTTRLRPNPLPGKSYSEEETAIIEEQGGYSGPQPFRRTVSLLNKYCRMLYHPSKVQGDSEQAQSPSRDATGTRFDAQFMHDTPNLENASSRMIIPGDNSSYANSGAESDTTSALRASSYLGLSSTSNASAFLAPKVYWRDLVLTASHWRY